MSQNSRWPSLLGGGGGAVNSINVLSPLVNVGTASDPIIELGILFGTLTPSKFAGISSLGAIESIDTWSRNSFDGGSFSANYQPNAGSGYLTIQSNNLNLDPIANTPDETAGMTNNYINFDVNSSGFSFGDNGRAVLFVNNSAQHLGTGDIGEVAFINNYLNIGNGVDPISMRGMSYAYGFANINANVTVDGAIQGYGFQPTIDAAAILDPTSAFITAFYDSANIGTTVPGYTSLNLSPQIADVANNSSVNSINISPNIPSFTGNSGYNAIGLYGNYTGFGTGGYQGININPTATGVNYANGLSINMSNVTGSNIKAMEIVGDVSITGALAFTGGLSIGQLNAFYASTVIDGGGVPQTLQSLTTQITAPNGVTTANADTIGVNTAMLISLEANSITTSGPFQLGLTALALPCVVETHTGSTLDFMSGTTAAVSLSGTSTGGTIDDVRGSRSVFVPNGITIINKSRGFYYDEPFGGVATDSWGLYIADAQKNYIEAPLKVGAGADTPDAGTTLHVEGDSKLEGVLEHLSGNLGVFGATPIAQPTTASASATLAAVGGASIQANDTFDGYTLAQVVKALRDLGILQ